MNLRTYIARPHPYVVAAILLLSLAAGAFHVSRHQRSSVNLDSENIYLGVVQTILSEEEVERGPNSVSGVEQTLSVQIQFPNESVTKQVLNDFIPVQEGDRIYVQASLLGQSDETFYLVDVSRSHQLWWLALFFALLVILVSGVRGAYALVGLLFSFVVIFLYLVPQMLAGANPIVVGLVSSILILAVTIYVSHGYNRKSAAALIGIVTTLALVGLIAHWFVGATHFSGFSGEESVYLTSQTENKLNLVDILIAGIIIAAIGILDDVAISQASTVFSLSSVRGDLSNKALFRKAMEVGRDHIASVINTLVLAYAGASLPLLLLLTVSNFPLEFIINGEIIAEEIVRTLLSSSGLVLAVPITTLAAVLLRPSSEKTSKD